MHDLDIVQPQALRGLLDESRLLAGGLDQRQTPLGIDDGQRQTRKSGAGADIGHASAVQIGLQAQAVEHVLAQHARAVADGRQIELRIAELEFVHELEQRLAAVGVQDHSDVARTRGE